MTQVEISKYVTVPSGAELSEEVGRPRIESAVPTSTGFPGLVRFSLGASPSADREGALTLDIEQDVAERKVRVHATDAAERGTGWLGELESSSEFMIAVVDKSSGSAHVFEAAGECLLSRYVAVAPEAERGEESGESITYRERKVNLLGEFGGKRAKDRQAKIDRNQITDARVSSDAAVQLEGAIGHHRERSVSLGGRDPKTTSILAPPHNPAPLRVEDAYPLSGLLSSAEFAFLLNEARSSLASADAAADASQFSNPGWHPIVWDLMCTAVRDNDSAGSGTNESLARVDDIEPRCRRVMAAMYLHYLFCFAGVPGRKLGPAEYQALQEKTVLPDDVLELMLDRFTERKETASKYRFKSEANVSHILYYAVVLWLTASNFAVSTGIDSFATALGVKQSTILVHVAHIGGRVKRSRTEDAPGAAQYRVSLPIPLVFPAMRRARRTPNKRK